MRGVRRAIAGCLGVLVAVAADASALEIRVRSHDPAGGTDLIVDVGEATVEVTDRTPGAGVPADGMLAAGTAFADEITLEVRAPRLERPLSIDVSDDLVSAVRARPLDGGIRLVVFVRRPVAYTVRAHPAGRGFELALSPAAVRAPEPAAAAAAGGGAVSVDADAVSYDRDSDTVRARGGVTIVRGATTLRAEDVQYARTAEIARAAGRVSLVDPEMTIHGSAAEVDLGRELGWVENATADLPDSRYRLEARRLEKCGPASYRAEDGVFTTCRCGGLEAPTWSVSTAEADVTLGSYGTARDARFHLLDVPVLYLPRLVFPAATERQSGLLLPRLGYSSRDGLGYQQPFYWAIDKSSDATFVADVETAARAGGAAEYRYVRSREARGAIAGLLYNEHIGGDLDRSEAENIQVGDRDIPENRYAFFGRHVQPFVRDSRLYADLFYLSDDLFLREIDVPAGVDIGRHPHNTRFTRSRAGVIETWNGGLVQLEAAYFQDLVDPQELTLQRVPRLRAEHAVPLLAGRVVARLAGDTAVFQREQGFDGWRTQIAPELFVPFQLGRFAYGSVRGLVREQLYYLTDTEQMGIAIPNNPEILPRFRKLPSTLAPALDRAHAEDSAEVSARLGTQLARVYEFRRFGLERLRHTIEPEVRFDYVSDVSRRFETFVLPPCSGNPDEREGIDCNGRVFTEPYLFDQDDAINRRRFLSYGLTTRLFGRSAPRTPPAASAGDPATPASAPGAPRELARLSVLHGYDVSRRLVNDSHASDVDLGLRLTPVRYGGLGYGATVSFQERRVIGQSVGLFLREDWEPPAG
ncbi:MAG TPA: LPS assembly protein LptD, partial [Candidatus Limnocylindria bacterium]|nr:LPS assembly protein LptD [Candidatus Limnocylindria bacterium]